MSLVHSENNHTGTNCYHTVSCMWDCLGIAPGDVSGGYFQGSCGFPVLNITQMLRNRTFTSSNWLSVLLVSVLTTEADLLWTSAERSIWEVSCVTGCSPAANVLHCSPAANVLHLLNDSMKVLTSQKSLVYSALSTYETKVADCQLHVLPIAL